MHACMLYVCMYVLCMYVCIVKIWAVGGIMNIRNMLNVRYTLYD